MEKTTVKTLGKLLSGIAILIAGAGTLLLTFAGSLAPSDTHDIIYGVAILLTAVGAYLAHNYAQVS